MSVVRNAPEVGLFNIPEHHTGFWGKDCFKCGLRLMFIWPTTMTHFHENCKSSEWRIKNLWKG